MVTFGVGCYLKQAFPYQANEISATRAEEFFTFGKIGQEQKGGRKGMGEAKEGNAYLKPLDFENL